MAGPVDNAATWGLCSRQTGIEEAMEKHGEEKEKRSVKDGKRQIRTMEEKRE